jgi:hypothetical protein
MEKLPGVEVRVHPETSLSSKQEASPPNMSINPYPANVENMVSSQ